MSHDHRLTALYAGTLVLLAVLSIASWIWCRIPSSSAAAGATALNFQARMRSFWGIAAVLMAALYGGLVSTVVLFALLSVGALSEVVACSSLGTRDHRALVWSFYVVVPAQYGFVLLGADVLRLTFVPVAAFVLVPFLVATSGDPREFLTRTGTIGWALLTCVYALSFGPALLSVAPQKEGGAALLFYCILVVQLSDFLQYAAGRRFGHHPLAPTLSPAKTVEGLAGGMLGAIAVGTALAWTTPFGVFEALALSVAVTVAGVAGGLVFSAVKRAAGIKDFGSWLSGHGGLLDRIDSLCFSLPAAFFLSRYFVHGG